MSDELTAPRSTRSAAAPVWRAPALQALAIIVLGVVLGAAAGLLWHQWWTPATGLVWDHQWYKGVIWIHPKTLAQGSSEVAYQDVFAATGTYVVLTALGGLVLGLIASLWLARAELVTLAACILGGAGGAALAARIGFALSAPDPNVLARHLPNQTELPANIHWAGPWLILVMPGFALAALGVVFLLVDRRPARPSVGGPVGAGDLGGGQRGDDVHGAQLGAQQLGHQREA